MILSTWIIDDEPMCVRVAHEIVEIDILGAQLTATTLAPRPLSLPSPILIGLEPWSSATPNSMKYLVCSQSGSPNSQNAPPNV